MYNLLFMKMKDNYVFSLSDVEVGLVKNPEMGWVFSKGERFLCAALLQWLSTALFLILRMSACVA